MAVERSYRIDRCEHDISPEHPDFPIFRTAHLYGEMGSCSGSVLVPDTRLQAITDAWVRVFSPLQDILREDWPALRELIALLDTLTEDNDG